MIDTIRGYLNLDSHVNPISIIDLQSKLDNPKIQQNPQSHTGFLKGQIKNFKISIRYSLSDLSDQFANQISFEGSAPKFIYENNIAQVSPDDIRLVLEALSDSLSITLDDAKITRLDFGFNFVVRRPISYYIQAIQEFPRMQRVLYQGQTVSFRTSSRIREITFYDKLREMRKDLKSRETFKALPDFIKDLSILRYEVKLLKCGRIEFVKKLKFSDLTDPIFFSSLYENLSDTFSKLRIVDFEFPSKSFVSHGWLKDFLAFIGLQKYGMNEAYNLINSHDYNSKNLAVAKSQDRSKIKELVSKSKEILQTSVKTELAETLAALNNIFIQFN